MSIESLREDLKGNLERLKTMSFVTPQQLLEHLRDSLWPFVEALVDEVDEIDGSVADMVEDAPEILHTESGQVFAGLIAGGIVLADELATRAPNDNRLLRLIREWKELATKGTQILNEIVIPDDEGDDDGDDEEDGGDGDDGDEQGDDPKKDGAK